jgi:hypothetical protein
MGDKYLEEFDKVTKRKWSEGMGAYREARHSFLPLISSAKFYRTALKKNNLGGKDSSWEKKNLDYFRQLKKLKKSKDSVLRARFKGVADKYLESAQENGNIDDATNALKIYEKLGIGGRPRTKKKIVEFVGEYARKYDSSKFDLRKDLAPFRRFLRGKYHGDLEKKAGTAVGVVGILASLFFLSPIVTGNAVANMVDIASGSIGGALFVLGIGGVFISCKRR